MSKDLLIYLGIDWGEKRIGLALADSETKLATPFKTVSSLEELISAIHEEQADVLVLGKPIKMKGESEGLNPDFSDFLEEIKKALPDKQIELFDERLSSRAADALPGGSQKASRDEVAAMIILQDYLDKK